MNLQQKKAVLVGLGRSSVAAARLLIRHGASPFVSELSDHAGLDPWREACRAQDIPYETGGHSEAVFKTADLIVLSPGVPAAVPLLAGPRKWGIPIMGELELAWRFCTSRVIGVTGTNGKTTVTTLLAAMARECGHATALAGNNDTPLSLVVIEESQPEFVVLEVSSYQLETAQEFHPWMAAVLNLTPDHLDRHGSMEQYAAAKARIFSRQQRGDIALVNADDPWVSAMPVPQGATQFFFSLERRGERTFYGDATGMYFEEQKIAGHSDNPLPGRHNLANALAALACMHAGGFETGPTLRALRQFKGVEHRMEYVCTLKGVAYYNDSKSTNLDSLRVALDSFAAPLVLLAGGRGKGADYRPLRELVRAHVKRMIVFGEDAPLLSQAFGDAIPVDSVAGMMDAVSRAHACAQPGDVVLLSPACASFDMYRNFEERGRDFKECVRHLTPDSNAWQEHMA